MALEGLRARLSLGGDDRRYVDPDDVDAPEDVADPRTIRDETAPSLAERLLAYRWFLFTVSSAVVAALVLALIFGAQVVPDILSNPWLHRGVAGITIFGAGYVLATKRAYGALVGIDRLHVKEDGRARSYPGEYVPGPEDDYDLFIPIKGFSMWGHRKRPLTVEELDADLARRWARANRDPSDPARIRVDDALADLVRTEYGTQVVVHAGGYKADTFGRDAVAAFEEPDRVDQSEYDALGEQLEHVRDENQRLRERYSALLDHTENMREDLRKPVDQLVQERLGEFATFARAARGRAFEDEEIEGLPSTEGMGDDHLARIDEEVSPDGE